MRLALPLIAFGSISLAGCAQITVVGEQGPPSSEWKFGVLAVELAPSAQNSIVSSSGIGIVSTPSGTTFGYANARIVRLGGECRVVISIRDLDALRNDEELSRLLKSTHKACAA